MRSNSDALSRQRGKPKTLRGLLAVAIALLIGFVLYVNRAPEEESADLVETLPESALARPPQRLPQPPAEDIPIRREESRDSAVGPEVETADIEGGAPEASLTLESSDPDVRESLAAIAEVPPIRDVLLLDMLIQRAVGLVDGISRGFIPTQVMPLPAPSAPFLATVIDGEPYLDTAGYARYDRVVRWLDGVDVRVLVDAFHRFRPLLEQAYGELGNSPDEMDNALIRALDRIIDTPQLGGPIALRRDSVMYSFADPALENRNALQKQLLRLGPENLAKVQAMAADLRARLLAYEAD
jgi:hypothetical protein